MFQSVLILLGVAVILYVAHLLLKSYLNKSLSWESFQSPPVPIRQSQNSIPSPAAVVRQEVSEEPLRVVSSAGPNPPNAETPSARPSPPEKTKPLDPYQEVNSETPIRDNLRHPENSFGPGVQNSGTAISTNAGIASDSVKPGASQFSPEFAQNGGDFMNGIGAHDAFGSDSYATI